jgi:hypothetical protein
MTAIVQLAQTVMRGLVPRIHAFGGAGSEAWMAGTSPAMTAFAKRASDGVSR